MLNIVDAQWKDHLLLYHLKEVSGCADTAEGPVSNTNASLFYLFQAMLDRIDTRRFDTCSTFQVQVRRTGRAQLLEPPARQRRGRSPY